MAEGGATSEGPPRRRESWSIKTIVEDLSGRPISDFQDPSRPVHPYLKAKMGAAAPPATSHPSGSRAPGDEPDEDPDPIDRVYPPLTGPTGRALHGPELEHHAATLASVAHHGEAASPGHRPHRPGPSQRPERVYLHYLLLHLDHLDETALRYLQRAVDEELHHRATPPTSG